MKLLLHIGTHKTATTSLQHFFALNRSLLKTHGFFYPENDDSAYVFNFLASRVAFGKAGETAAFLTATRKKAEEANCHTVVISGESFYAMTGFFLDLQKRERSDNYWTHEERLVQDVKEACAGYEDILVTCTFRPQDELAGSLYNQFVKNVFGISESYSKFLEHSRPIYDYAEHLSLWEKAFGKEALRLKNFNAVKKDIIRDFCASFLTETCFEQASIKELESNTRLNRDILEVKRLYNATKPDPALAFVSARTFRAINDHFPDSDGYQVFANPDEQKAFFSAFQAGNDTLCQSYGLTPLPAYSEGQALTYPGLNAQKTAEIYLQFCENLYSPRNRVEIGLRRTARFIMDKMPGGKAVMDPVRKLHNSLRLRLSGW
ncbi:MAG: hypothetical protein KDI65_03950 [Alphaproteobacteria bacterium]|nr:hypothetical protein [Alphaproteobacteria bacterium]